MQEIKKLSPAQIEVTIKGIEVAFKNLDSFDDETGSGVYLPDEVYERLVGALINPDPCAVTGEVTADQIKIILGTVGNIWPEGLLRD
ncbi:hypothetical protein [Beijerinckia mobilis]|uniref:hypothetical protein n=1 Tax=Beijerinckia mobilis TaxID=231434 RepID=UPI000558897C|nr:hypothetical protein [Beijerinckia mobilis]